MFSMSGTARSTKRGPWDRHTSSSRRQTPASHHRAPSFNLRTPSSHYRTPPYQHSSSGYQDSPSDDAGLGEGDIEMPSESEDGPQWPRITELVYSGRNKIDLKPQSKHIKELLRLAVDEFRADLFFICTFPGLEKRVKMLRKVFLRVAEELELPQEICARLEQDPDYNEALAGVVCCFIYW